LFGNRTQKAMLALSWPFDMAQGRPLGFPPRFADSFGLAQDRSGGRANSLRSDNAPPSFRSRLYGSATPKARNKKNQGI
jgi:hypothetical protein